MSRIALNTPGHLYAILSASTPGLIKVGQTTLDPHERARQLTASTSSPTPFFCAYSRPTNDANASESHAHELLDAYRINSGREFFRISLEQAILTIDHVCGGERAIAAVALSYVDSGPPVETPYADLMSTFEERESDGYTLNETEQAAVRALERNLYLTRLHPHTLAKQ